MSVTAANLVSAVGESVYPLAKSAAVRIHDRFAAEHELARDTIAPLPDVAAIELIINSAFWTSLRREEGYIPRISFAFIAPEHVAEPLLLERPLPLVPHLLTKVAPAVERPGIHLGVWPHDGILEAWGTTRELPRLCFVLEIIAPGVIVVKHRRGEDAGKFINVAVLQGDQVKIVDERVAAAADCPALLSQLLGLQSRVQLEDTVSVLVELSVSMRAHGRGGTILVVRAGDENWRESVAPPFGYSVQPAFTSLAALASVIQQGERRAEFRREIEAVAGLTAVDGATVINERYDLLAFGAKIVQRPGQPRVEQLLVTEPVEGGAASVIEPGAMGGTRHTSAAQFAHDQRGALALVASQDGRFTAFEWSGCENMVHAHRLETLLL